MIGERALALAVAELGVHEDPRSSNTGPRVREYLAGCERNSKPLGLTSGAWCAAFASWCGWMSVTTFEVPPHLWRASVAELVEDARTSGAWSQSAGSWPHCRPGDLAVFSRGYGNPLLGGQGHVGRVESLILNGFTSIEGNSGDRVARVHRLFSDHELLGFIMYPADDAYDGAPD